MGAHMGTKYIHRTFRAQLPSRHDRGSSDAVCVDVVHTVYPISADVYKIHINVNDKVYV